MMLMYQMDMKTKQKKGLVIKRVKRSKNAYEIRL
jgi:hypothetical protein